VTKVSDQAQGAEENDPTEGKGTGEWRKLHNEELYNLLCTKYF